MLCVGHNGSSKSTTIRLIRDGLLEAESGEIIIDGDSALENVWEKRRHIGMVFKIQTINLWEQTAEDDVAFGLENQGDGLPNDV